MIALKAERYMSNVQTLNAVSSAQTGQFVTIFNGLKMLSQNFGAAEQSVYLTGGQAAENNGQVALPTSR